MSKKMVSRKEDRHCKALKYAEKVSRLLDDRYFDALAAAFDAADMPAFVAICMNDLGLTEDFAKAIWARITAPVPPTEGW